MKTAEGESELVCKTKAAEFDSQEGRIQRGVISYYATQTFLNATTVETWLESMREAMAAERGVLKLERPLQIAGDGKMQLPEAIKSAR